MATTAEWVLLYDERNPYFSNPDVGCIAYLSLMGTKQWKPVSWQQMIHQLGERLPEAAKRVAELQGFA